jgi:methyltransferase family protein
MILRILQKLSLAISAPIRYAVRYELKRWLQPDQNIRMALRRKATAEAADYVAKHMRNVDSVSSRFDLLTNVLKMADIGAHKLVCEFGVHSGKSINYIASRTECTVYGFDSFNGLPERWRDGFRKGLFKRSSLPKVLPNVQLIQGLFNETLPAFLQRHDGEISFLHIDCVLYSSTRTVLDLLRDRIRPGCVIVFDEYFNYPGWEEGEYKAFHEFLVQTALKYEYIGYNYLHEQVAVIITSS